MKKFLIIGVLFINSCFGQKAADKGVCQTKDVTFIKNNKIEYSIGMASCDTCVPIRNKGYRAIVMLSIENFKKAEGLSKECWMSLLENENTNWAANLILYSIYDRDALLLSRSNEKDWKKFLKKDDIDYWRKNLK